MIYLITILESLYVLVYIPYIILHMYVYILQLFMCNLRKFSFYNMFYVKGMFIKYRNATLFKLKENEKKPSLFNIRHPEFSFKHNIYIIKVLFLVDVHHILS